ncbi:MULTISPECIES: sensor histidine kinase [unclassified Nocardioides]|uniref:sensor histidine kinase n=1 Tax=unclassified Nocardioides TaxID=2615069 RepID=UPI00361FD67F
MSVVAAVAAALLAVLATVGSIVLRALDGLPPSAPSVAGVAFAVTGGVLAARRPRSVPGWLLILAGVALSVSSLASDWAHRALVTAPGSLPGGEAALWVGSWAWAAGYCVAATLLPLRLPDGARPRGAWRVVWWVAVVVTVLAPIGWAVTPYDRMDQPPLDPMPPGVTSPAGLDVGPTLLAALLPLVMLCALAGLVSLVLRLRASVGEERQQLKWVVYGGVLSILLLALGQVVSEAGSDLLLGISMLPLPLGIAMAGLRYRLWDVDHVIRRTLTYAVLTGLVVAMYAAAVLLLGDALGDRTGAPLLATVVVALTAEPARQRVQRLVDRVTRGDRADPYGALVRLSGRLEAAAAEPAGAEALTRVAEAVRHALQLPWATVDVLDGPSASSGTVTGDGVEVPLVHGGQLVGHLVVGPRRADRALSAGDLRLLDDLARPVAVAAHAAHLRDALQTSRERLVMAREEERRRLRHDLHDDLGPVLAAVALQLGEVRSQIGDHPVAPLAARAESLLTGAVATVRRIVDGLRPAALDELGLAEALHAAAEGFEAGGLEVDVEVRGELRDLPAAVEVAALRIATEALSNAARHAGAGRVRLGVERLPRTVEVTVADDGRGLADAAEPGVGLVSMRERAEELGGGCTVTTGPGGGTVVVAWLPAPADRAADERVRQ